MPPSLARLLALAFALAGLALAAPRPATAAGPAPAPASAVLVTCAPGYPGTTAEAQPAMDALAAALGRHAGWPPGALTAVYQPTEAGGLERLRGGDAAVALVALPFFLAHDAALGLEPRLQAAPAGGGAVERWSLVARRGRVARPADLEGFTVLSTAGYAPAFVQGALGAWGRLPASAKVESTGQILSALRRAAGGADVAVLVDGAQAAALPTLPFAGQLEVVARSEPVPTSVVATVGKRLPAARWMALERALLGLHEDPAAAPALAGVRLTRFSPLDAAALAAARAMVRGPAGGGGR